MTTKPVKIALIGHMRSGKDTVAYMIAEELAPSATNIVGLADQLKWMAELPGYPLQRELYQNLGAAVRKAYPEFWIDTLLARCKGLDGNIVVKDVRYQNEADSLKLAGYQLVAVYCPPSTLFQRSGLTVGEFNRAMAHESESGIETVVASVFCPQIINGPEVTLDNLRVKVKNLLRSWEVR